MKLVVERLGPVKRGSFELGDITLLLGPPNTGKSYTMKALYSKLFPLDEYSLKTFGKMLERSLERHIRDKLDKDPHFNAQMKDLMTILVASYMVRPDDLGKLVRDLGIKRIEVQERGERARLRVALKLELDDLSSTVGELVRELTGAMVPLKRYSMIEFYPLDLDDVVREIARLIGNLDDGDSDNLLEWKTFARQSVRYVMSLFDSLDVLYKLVFKELTGKTPDLKGPSTMAFEYPVFFIQSGDLPSITEVEASLSLETSLKKSPEHVSPEIVIEFVRKILSKKEYNYNPEVRDAAKKFVNNFKNFFAAVVSHSLSGRIAYSLRKSLSSSINLENVRFIPFGRSVLVLGIESAAREPFERGRIFTDLLKDLSMPLASFSFWLSKGRSDFIGEKLRKKQKELLKAALPLLEGKLISSPSGKLLYRDWRDSEVELSMSSALVEEVSGLLMALLTVDEGSSLIIVEEPEAQLHIGAHIIMALFLSSLPKLCGCKVVASTHSDILAITLSQLVTLRPNDEQVSDLIRRILPHIRDEKLARWVANSAKNLDLKIYEFTRKGTVNPVDPIYMTSKEVPGISRAIDELTSWSMGLALGGEADTQSQEA